MLSKHKVGDLVTFGQSFSMVSVNYFSLMQITVQILLTILCSECSVPQFSPEIFCIKMQTAKFAAVTCVPEFTTIANCIELRVSALCRHYIFVLTKTMGWV